MLARSPQWGGGAAMVCLSRSFEFLTDREVAMRVVGAIMSFCSILLCCLILRAMSLSYSTFNGGTKEGHLDEMTCVTDKGVLGRYAIPPRGQCLPLFSSNSTLDDLGTMLERDSVAMGRTSIWRHTC